MTCKTDCQQGRRCGCLIADQGLHRHEGPFHDHTPLPTPEDCESWADLFWWAILAGLVIACVVGPLYFGVTP